MAKIDSLKPSITELPRSEAIRIILAVRESRRHTPAKSPSRKKKPAQRYTATQLKSHLSKDEMLKLIKEMGGI